MVNNIDIESVKFQLDLIQDRLIDTKKTIKEGVGKDIIQSIYYGLFDDSLDAAGFLDYLGEPEEKIYACLKDAAHAGMVLFQYQGKTTAHYFELPEFDEHTFIDYSVTNPSIYVRAIYAAAIVSEMAIIKGLISIPVDMLLKGQELVKDDLVNFLRYIPAIIGQPAAFVPYPQKTFWSMQQNVLKAVLETPDPTEEIKKLEQYLTKYYSKEQYEYKAERLYLLPVHGLKAIQKLKDKL